MHSQSKLRQPSKFTRPPPPEDLILRNPNDQKIHKLLKEDGPMTRDQLAKRTGLARTTVYDTLTRLAIRGLVDRYTEHRQARGRRRVFYETTS